MIEIKQYATEQRRQLLAFFIRNSDRQFTVDEITRELSKTTEISRSSVYRNIGHMVHSGDLVRKALDSGRKFAYSYVGDGECHAHLHLKCEGCGKLIHADRQLSESVLKAAAQSGNFHIDRKKTVLYGSCGECMK